MVNAGNKRGLLYAKLLNINGCLLWVNVQLTLVMKTCSMQGFCEMLCSGRGNNSNRGRPYSLKTNSDNTKCFLRGSRGFRQLVVVMMLCTSHSPYFYFWRNLDFGHLLKYSCCLAFVMEDSCCRYCWRCLIEKASLSYWLVSILFTSSDYKSVASRIVWHR